MKIDLKNLVISATTTVAEFPLCKGMEVEIAYANKKLLANMHANALVQKFDSETAAPYNELDTEKYIYNYVKEVVKGWKGFTYGHLATLVLIEEEGLNMDEEIEFDIDTAVFLMSNSPAFDQWVVNTAKRLENFRK